MTTNYEDLRKKASVKSALPEGWGRSVIGDREIVTGPTQKAEVNPNHILPSSSSETPSDDDVRLTDGDLSYNNTLLDDLEQEEIDENASEEMLTGVNRTGGFREEDLASQYKSLMSQYGNSPLGQQAISKLITEEDDGSDEGLQFLKESIKYGRGK